MSKRKQKTTAATDIHDSHSQPLADETLDQISGGSISLVRGVLGGSGPFGTAAGTGTQQVAHELVHAQQQSDGKGK